MAKVRFIIVCIFTCSFGQAKIIKDTVFVCENYITTLIFPSEMVIHTIGDNEHVAKSADPNNREMLFLQSSKEFKQTNLTVKTMDKTYYNITVIYSETAPKFHPFVHTKEIEPQTQTIAKDTVLIVENSQINTYKKMAEELFKKKRKIYNVGNTMDKLLVTANNIGITENYILLKMAFFNRGNITFEVASIVFDVTSNESVNRTANQDVPIEPIYHYPNFTTINKGERKEVVYIFPKFTFLDNKSFRISIQEADGDRILRMKLENDLFNNGARLSE